MWLFNLEDLLGEGVDGCIAECFHAWVWVCAVLGLFSRSLECAALSLTPGLSADYARSLEEMQRNMTWTPAETCVSRDLAKSALSSMTDICFSCIWKKKKVNSFSTNHTLTRRHSNFFHVLLEVRCSTWQEGLSPNFWTAVMEKKLWYYRNKAQKWKIHAVKPYEQSSSHARLQLQSHSMQYSSKWISKLKTQDQMLRVCWLFSCTIQDKIPGWAVNRKRSKQCKTLCSVVMGIMKARIWIWLWMAIRIRKM